MWENSLWLPAWSLWAQMLHFGFVISADRKKGGLTVVFSVTSRYPMHLQFHSQIQTFFC